MHTKIQGPILLLLSLLLFTELNHSFAQNGDEDLDQLVQDTKSDMLVVIGGGLAGSILGLSTLSFVDEPKEHTRNITIGASLGIIAGVAYVALSQANKSRDLIYGEEQAAFYKNNTKTFGTLARSSWHGRSVTNNDSLIRTNFPSFGFSVTY